MMAHASDEPEKEIEKAMTMMKTTTRTTRIRVTVTVISTPMMRTMMIEPFHSFIDIRQRRGLYAEL